MTRLLVALDRIAGLVLALVLVAGGLLLLDWRLGLVLDLPIVAHISPVLDLVGRVWWPVVAAVIAVLLVLLALRWLVAHLPRVRTSDARLAATPATVASPWTPRRWRGPAPPRWPPRWCCPTPAAGSARCAAAPWSSSTPTAPATPTSPRSATGPPSSPTTWTGRSRPASLPLRVIVDAPRTRVRDRGRRTRARVQ